MAQTQHLRTTWQQVVPQHIPANSELIALPWQPIPGTCPMYPCNSSSNLLGTFEWRPILLPHGSLSKNWGQPAYLSTAVLLSAPQVQFHFYLGPHFSAASQHPGTAPSCTPNYSSKHGAQTQTQTCRYNYAWAKPEWGSDTSWHIRTPFLLRSSSQPAKRWCKTNPEKGKPWLQKWCLALNHLNIELRLNTPGGAVYSSKIDCKGYEPWHGKNNICHLLILLLRRGGRNYMMTLISSSFITEANQSGLKLQLG